jgi:putative peptide zinc metalloprotease protein
MFRDDPGTTFSDIWYRVSDTRPRLTPHAHVVRQAGARVTYIVEEPAGGQYFRMTEPAYFFVGLLDGRRTVGEAWDACNAQLADAAPTQRECIEVLGKLRLFGLLLGDVPLAADMVLERKRQARSRWWLKRTGRGMFLSIPLLNPEPWLERHAYLLRAVWSRAGLIAWLVVVLSGGGVLLLHLREFGSRFDTAAMLAPGNLLWVMVVFLVLRVLHEFGHATACKAMGGRSTEIGLLLIAWVLPLPYCDATSAWRFPETWRRVLVSAAGMMAELFAAGVAAFVWAGTRGSGGLAQTLAYNTILVSGVTTIVFNINPLLRYDGYYILSDVAGTPNLAQRARDFWRFLLERFAFGIRATRPPEIRDAGEAWLLGVYGALSWPYRMVVAVTIIVMIAGSYATLGVVLAAITGMAWLVWPILKGAGYLAGSPRLLGRRGRAVGVSCGVAGVLLVVIGVIPMPAAGYAIGAVEPLRMAGVRAGEGGFVRRVLVRAGEWVEPGAPMFELENAQLRTEAAMSLAQRDRARAERDAAMSKSPAEQQVATVRLAQAEQALRRARGQLDSLTVRAPAAGRVVPAVGTGVDMANLEGRFAGRGVLLAYVADTDRLVVRASVSEAERAYIFRRGEEIGDARWLRPTVRVRGQAGDEIKARVTRVGPAGVRELDNPALTREAGGDVTTDPDDPKGQTALAAQFLVELVPDRMPTGTQPGLRARVRFGVPSEPLLKQWWRRARQAFPASLGL